MSTAEPLVPSRPQAALAIALIKAKPPGTSVRDYILQFRRQVKKGPPLLSELEHSHHLDLVAYWQEQYQRVQNECDVLRSENTKLERSNQLLTNRTAQPHDNELSTLKRKSQTASTARACKRPKASQQKTAEQSVDETQEAIENDFDFLDGIGEDGTTLTEALFTTHKLCRISNPDGESLCVSLVHTSNTLGKVIRLITLKHEQLSVQSQPTTGPASLDQDKSGFALAMTVCARAFMSILVGIQKMGEASQDERLSHLVVCELASSFKTALMAIESAARQTAQSVKTTIPEPHKGKDKRPLVRESAPARALAHLLIAFLGFLDKNDRTHQQLFDGFVYLLLERVGRRLFYCTFGRHRSTNIGRGIEPLPEATDEAGILRSETEALSIKFEVKALVLILERAMGLAPGHMNPQSSKSNRSTTQLSRTLSLKNLPSASKARLSTVAKDRLQRTLITCMYGDKVSDEFLDVLTKRIPGTRPGSLPNVAKINDKDVDEWYKKEIWRLVGWDVLARESGW